MQEHTPMELVSNSHQLTLYRSVCNSGTQSQLAKYLDSSASKLPQKAWHFTASDIILFPLFI